MASTNADGRVSYTEHELKDPELRKRLETEVRLREEQEQPIRLQVGRENEPWRVEVGTNYSASYKSDETSNDNSSASRQEPAPTTESPSSQPPVVEDSTARSISGNGPTTANRQSGSPARAKKATPAKTVPAKKQARATNLDDFNDF